MPRRPRSGSRPGVAPVFGLHWESWRDACALASAPGVRAVALTGVAQMMFVAHHGVGATTMVGTRDSVACANSLQRPGATTRHARVVGLTAASMKAR